MSNELLNFNHLFDSEINRQRILWVDTFYYSIPCNIVDSKSYSNLSYTIDEAKPKYIDIKFQFKIDRISELQFRIIFKRTQNYSILPGKYAFQFHCDSNIFVGDPKVIHMISNQFISYADFWLHATYREDFSSDDLRKQLELKISVEMIEYDYVFQFNLWNLLEELRNRNSFFYDESVTIDMCYILQIRRLEDIFAGRQNKASCTAKISYLSRAAYFSKDIVNYLRSKLGFPTMPVKNVDLLLKNMLNFKYEINDTDLVGIYLEACYLGLDFLKFLSRDCLLCRLSVHETENLTDYEYLLFELLTAAVRVNDKYLFETCAGKIHCSTNEDFVPERFIKKLEMMISSRFVLHSLERRRKKIESDTSFGIGAEETSRFFKYLCV